MKITPVPIFRDNYAYILECNNTGQVAVVDPAEPRKVIEALGQTVPVALLTTHHHADHAQGNSEMLAAYPMMQVYAADERVAGMTVQLNDREKIELGSLLITPLLTPGHTTGSVSYFVQDKLTRESAVFTGIIDI